MLLSYFEIAYICLQFVLFPQADLIKMLQSEPTAQMIADNINKIADVNSISRPVCIVRYAIL